MEELNIDGVGKFSVHRDLSEDIIERIINFSTDEEDVALQENTSDKKRFKDREAFDEWLKKGRSTFVLSDSENNIAAFIWYGERNPPETIEENSKSWDTIAFRAYEPYRGKGIMRPFSEYVLSIWKENTGRKMWLEVHKDNVPGIRLYEKLGFKTVGVGKDERIVMALES